MDSQFTTIVIGAGPAGSSASIYLSRFCHNVILIDAPSQIHGRTSMATGIANFLGNERPYKGSEFLDRVNTQLSNYPIERVTEKVVKVSKAGENYQVETDKQTTYEARYLVLAIGVGDNMPSIKGLDPYWDTAIFHCMTCDWYDHRDKKSAVIANDDRGITTALAINSMNRPSVLSVVPAQPSPSYTPEMVDKAKAAGIAVYMSPLKELKGENGSLEALILDDGTQVEAEAMFTKLGHKRYDQFLDAGGIQVDREPEEGFIKINWQTFESSQSNLFAVGPCNEGPDQVAISAGEGAMAAMEIHRRILAAKGI
jgi:thioredoxin reductase